MYNFLSILDLRGFEDIFSVAVAYIFSKKPAGGIPGREGRLT